MPTIEAVASTITPKIAEKPIPTITVSTRPRSVKTDNPGQQIKNDTSAVEDSTAKTEESVRLSPQLSAIARKEQAFRQREQALKAREKEIADKLALAEKYEQLKTKMSAQDYSDAEELGLKYEDYTKHILNKQDPDPKDQKVQELEAKLQSIEKSLEESAATQFEETVAEYKSEISKLVAADPEFSSIKELGREDAVLQLILDAFESDGEALTVAEAAKQVEDYLTDFGKKFTSLPKFKKETETEKVLPRPVVGKTLTNDMTASSDRKPLKPLHLLSEAERYAEARRRVEARRKG